MTDQKNKGRLDGNQAASQQQFKGDDTAKPLDPLAAWFSLASGVKARMKKKGARHGKR
jgi:hypothetical protein